MDRTLGTSSSVSNVVCRRYLNRKLKRMHLEMNWTLQTSLLEEGDRVEGEQEEVAIPPPTLLSKKWTQMKTAGRQDG